MPKLRLIKVIVQPMFVLDDGKHITEIDHPPIAIPADEWPAYSGERFPREVKKWQERLDAESASPSAVAPPKRTIRGSKR